MSAQNNASRPTLQCPGYIQILLQVHTTGKVELPQNPWTLEALEFLESRGAIRCTKGGWTTTEQGRAWVSVLCDVPIPRMVFVDESNKVIPTT